MSMTKKHYELVASALFPEFDSAYDNGDPEVVRALTAVVDNLVRKFESDNPNFKADVFRVAAGQMYYCEKCGHTHNDR